MDVHVRYFAQVRERLGLAHETVSAAEGATVADLLEALARRHPEFGRLRPHVRAAVNREFVAVQHVLRDGDELSLIPPVAGGSGAPDGSAGAARLLRISGEPLDPGEALHAVAHPDAGGIATFVGVVRRENEGRAVQTLTYEAYAEMAEATFARIADAAAERWTGARVAILHRVGTLAVGEVAVVVAASAPHRAEAFAACRFAIDTLKAEAPIWKKETGPDGSVWIGHRC